MTKHLLVIILVILQLSAHQKKKQFFKTNYVCLHYCIKGEMNATTTRWKTRRLIACVSVIDEQKNKGRKTDCGKVIRISPIHGSKLLQAETKSTLRISPSTHVQIVCQTWHQQSFPSSCSSPRFFNMFRLARQIKSCYIERQKLASDSFDLAAVPS